MSGPVYALNVFNVVNKEEYLTYSRRSAKEVQAHGGRVVALGKFREAMVGGPRREVLILWHLFDKLEDLRPLFK